MMIVYFVVVQLGYDSFWEWELKVFSFELSFKIFFLRFAYVLVRQGENHFYWKCQWSAKKGPRVSSHLEFDCILCNFRAQFYLSNIILFQGHHIYLTFILTRNNLELYIFYR